MGFEKANGILIGTFLCSLLSFCVTIHGLHSDFHCLKSIKDSFGLNLDLDEESICDFPGVQCWSSGIGVSDLSLSGMGLKGQFPRGIQNCSSLVKLDLSDNHLSGPIPSDISTLLPYATTIDLSSNKFSGEIPSSFGQCSYLSSLNLDNNTLSGQIPQELGNLPRLRSFSVSNNNLSGPVPVFYNGGFYSYANNSGLCGDPLEPCPLELDNSSGFHQSFKDGLIVGYALSVTSVTVVYLCYCTSWTQLLKHTKYNQRRKAKQVGSSNTNRKAPMVARQMHQLAPQQLVEKGSKEISVLLERLTSTMRFEELSDATNCFSRDNAIGVGKMGIMYQGRLPNGQYLAIKRLFNPHLFKRQFFQEIIVMGDGKYSHKNIMPLLGFCIEREERILVYEYMSNGKLSKWLQSSGGVVIRLKWPERVKIALGVARGLSWLHHSSNLHNIVHFSISSECILLDENFEPKISNFGEAKFMNPNIDNDLNMVLKVVDDGKKDVYDFGNVLFELITGKPYKELFISSRIANQCDNPSNFYDAIDESLLGKGIENDVFTLIKVACECVQPFPDQRPTMLEVYNNMSNIWERQHELNDDCDMLRRPEIASATIIDEIVECR